MGISIPAPSPQTEIEKVQLILIQSTKMISRGKKSHSVECKPEKFPFMSIEGEELKNCIRKEGHVELQSGFPLVGNWVARIPTDQRARPSTLQGSKNASIRVSHQLEVRIIFKTEKRRNPGQDPIPSTIYSASWPLILASCACKWRSLKLPMYSESEPLSDEAARAAVADWQEKHLRMGKKKHIDGCDPSLCSCGIPLDELLRYECEQDNAQQSSTIRLMREEIEAATLTPSTRRQSFASEQQDAFDEFNLESQQIAHHRQVSGFAQMQQEERTRLQLEQKARQEYR